MVLVIIFLVFPSIVIAQGFSLIDESDPDTVVTTPDRHPEEIPYDEFDTDPYTEDDYQFFVGDWRGGYILFIILPPFIFFFIFFLSYRNRVENWVANERTPRSLRNLNSLFAILLTVLTYGGVFVIWLSLIERTAGLILFGILALIFLIIALVRLRT